MPKKQTSRLGLPQVGSDSSFASGTGLVRGSSTTEAEKDREWIEGHQNRQLTAIHGISQVDVFAITQVQRINNQAVETFRDIAIFNDHVDQQVRGTAYEKDVVEFNYHMLQRSANFIDGYVCLGARQMGEILIQPVPLRPKPPGPEERQRKNWFQRILTGDEYRSS